MMLATLTAVAQALSLTFLYGEKKAFNILVDDAQPADADAPVEVDPVYDEHLIVLYHEGYVSGTSAEDQQGAWEPTYNLRLWLLVPNTGANDKPIDRLPRFEALEPLVYKVIRKIQAAGYDIIGQVRFQEGINWTDKGLDGFQFFVNAKAQIPVGEECE